MIDFPADASERSPWAGRRCSLPLSLPRCRHRENPPVGDTPAPEECSIPSLAVPLSPSRGSRQYGDSTEQTPSPNARRLGGSPSSSKRARRTPSSRSHSNNAISAVFSEPPPPLAMLDPCCQKTLLCRAMVTRPAPLFRTTALMPDGSFGEVALTDYRGRYVLLYFYPLDFTFVCPSEVLAFDRLTTKFAEKNVQLLACSVDSHYSHWAWTHRSQEKGGVGKLSHPLLSDLDKTIARQYNVLLDDDTVALRGLFLIDRKGVLRHQVVNDLPLGRSVDEAMRMVDALQYFERKGEVCPANWSKGTKGMKPTQDGLIEYLSKLAAHKGVADYISKSYR